MSRRVMVLVLAGLLAACVPVAGPTDGRVVLDEAAAQATAIIQRAQATALVLQAQAEATNLLSKPLAVPSATPLPPKSTRSPQPAPGRTAEPTTSPAEVRVSSVGMAADGAMIIIRFEAPPLEAEKWWPGNVEAIDETTGAVYNEIPVMPKIGPLIGRPKLDGQPGYVMLTNAAPGVWSGALVTVILGTYRFEHLHVE